MQSTPRKLTPAILTNAILIFLYVYFNYAVWAELNGEPNMLRLIKFGPFSIQDSHIGTLINGTQFVSVNGIVLMQNYPFWLFFVAIAINFYFLFRMQRSNETKTEDMSPKV